MKKLYILIIITAVAGNLYSKQATPSVRDPFWPIGYAPAQPVVEKPVEKPKPVEIKPEPPPPPKPVTADEWKMARKLLNINGYALGSKTENNEDINTSIVIINRNHYRSGDIIKITHADIEFIWRVGEIQNNSVDLGQESAKRLTNASKN